MINDMPHVERCHGWVRYWGRTELYWHSDEAIRGIREAGEKVGAKKM